MRASFKKYILKFKRPSGTSRGVMLEKETWFLILEEGTDRGIGECGLLRGLSIDDVDCYEAKLQWVCENIALGEPALLSRLEKYPSIQMGVEQAFLSLRSKDPFILFPSAFVSHEMPIPINGLIWMGSEDFMLEQIAQKLKAGFRCLKMKIGAIDFDTELSVLKSIRNHFDSDQVELRVDANGAFSIATALDRLKRLAQFQIHSIEQPIKPKQWGAMAELCQKSPIPIALDEELIGVFGVTKKEELLQTIRPQYIILKPSLVGGFGGSKEWIGLAEKHRIAWWVTSALESNIGLNAIAQFTHTLNNNRPQGLGTGSLYTNNFQAPLEVDQGQLYYRKNLSWQTNLIEDLCI